MGLLAILLFVCSLFLLYQGVALFGLVDGLSRISIDKLDKNNLLLVLGIEISKWGIILGVIGLVLCLLIFLDRGKLEESSGKGKNYIVFIVLYVIFAIASIC